MQIVFREFLKYKFFNSLFLGLSVGVIFIIYTPLSPSVYSLGGIVLALGIMLIAKFYARLFTLNYFFRVTLLVEVIMLCIICFFLLFSYNYMTALTVYAGYQATFAFGPYLVRAETLFLPKASLLQMVDITKQKGYLAGMLGAYLFYKLLDTFDGISTKQAQVYTIHFLLLAIECIIIFYVLRAFRKKP
jgi:putative membrane protein